MEKNIFDNFIKDYATGYKFEENKVVISFIGLDYRLEIDLIDFNYNFYSECTNEKTNRPAWELSKVNRLVEELRNGDKVYA